MCATYYMCVCVCVCVCGRPTQISQQVRRQYKTMNQISEKKKQSLNEMAKKADLDLNKHKA